jgi:hypothetical protein
VGQPISDNNNQILTFSEVKEASFRQLDVLKQLTYYPIDSIIRDPINRRPLFFNHFWGFDGDFFSNLYFEVPNIWDRKFGSL